MDANDLRNLVLGLAIILVIGGLFYSMRGRRNVNHLPAPPPSRRARRPRSGSSGSSGDDLP